MSDGTDTLTRVKGTSRSPGRTAGTGVHSRWVYLVSTRGHSLPSFGHISKENLGHRFVRITNRKSLVDFFSTADRHSVWVASDSAALAPLAGGLLRARGEQRLLVLDEMQEVSRHLLSTLFRYVVTNSSDFVILPFDELIEVLGSDAPEHRFVAGAVDQEGQAVLLYRGTVEPLVIPLAWFVSSSGRAKADPAQFRIIDCGQTISLGAFEASADAILYEFDAEYRRAARKQQLRVDTSSGAALRRLRLQKGLSRGDFPGIAEKTVARIERNEIPAPRGRTLRIIAERLGVIAEELPSF